MEWRRRVRAAFQWSLSAGYTVTAFGIDESGDAGFYLMTRANRQTPVGASRV
jgi:predicted GNAT superfamily acetyltransferase